MNNKVKTKDMYRSQVFPSKSSASGKPPTTLLVNKDVNKDEAMAGIALLDKHEQAMKRYEAQYEAKKNASYKPKAEWNRSTRSPSQHVSPYVSLLNEPEGYQLIQLK